MKNCNSLTDPQRQQYRTDVNKSYNVLRFKANTQAIVQSLCTECYGIIFFVYLYVHHSYSHRKRKPQKISKTHRFSSVAQNKLQKKDTKQNEMKKKNR